MIRASTSAAAAAAAATAAIDEGDRYDPWCVQCHTWRTLNCVQRQQREREREREREKERGDIPHGRCLYSQLRTQQIVPVVVSRLRILPRLLFFFNLLHVLGLASILPRSRDTLSRCARLIKRPSNEPISFAGSVIAIESARGGSAR